MGATLTIIMLDILYVLHSSPIVIQQNCRIPVLSTVVPRPLSNDPRFTQCIYRYSRASKRFVEVYVLTSCFSKVKNKVDPDQLASQEPADLDL